MHGMIRTSLALILLMIQVVGTLSVSNPAPQIALIHDPGIEEVILGFPGSESIEPEVPEIPERIRILARVTAYAPFDNKSGICADEDPSVTSIGHRPGPLYVAVDPKRIPYGTKLRIPGYGDVIAGDTGGKIRQYEGIAIDVFMNTYKETVIWGVQYLEIEIIEEAGP
jgi:3D (Asp-Asp-Asp) domain-containing protein